ncbi:hypothetical protein B0H13DRAFT_2326404 [Mycena leptocephala]|nr:hypothetical protein B0H13DRAFT_2326404 [Mycena leptocephala]
MPVCMPAPGPVLQPGSRLHMEQQSECSKIKEAWRRRDRIVIRTYTDFLRARALMQARIGASFALESPPYSNCAAFVVPACSKAIASKRSALQYPFEFNRWLEQHATSMPPSDPFGGAPHVPGSWHLYRNSDGTWDPMAEKWTSAAGSPIYPAHLHLGVRLTFRGALLAGLALATQLGWCTCTQIPRESQAPPPAPTGAAGAVPGRAARAPPGGNTDGLGGVASGDFGGIRMGGL